MWLRKSYFNPRTPVGCDGYFIALSQAGQVFQSTHPSGVRPFVHGGRQPTPTISIHAPQWGATDGGLAIANPIPISIHAPQWGATTDTTRGSLTTIISIHAPQWGATGRLRRHGAHRRISIHAPQWGATGEAAAKSPSSAYFNPRTPVGCDWPATPWPKYVR